MLKAVVLAAALATAPTQAIWPGVHLGDTRDQITAAWPMAQLEDDVSVDRPKGSLLLHGQSLAGEAFNLTFRFDGDRLAQLGLEDENLEGDPPLQAIAQALAQRLGGKPRCISAYGFFAFDVCHWETEGLSVSLTNEPTRRTVVIEPAAPPASWPGVRIGDGRARVMAAFPTARPSETFEGHKPALALPDLQVGGETFAVRATFDDKDRLERLQMKAVSPSSGHYLDALADDLQQRLGGLPRCRNMQGTLDLLICGWNVGDTFVSLMWLEGDRFITIDRDGPLSPALP